MIGAAGVADSDLKADRRVRPGKISKVGGIYPVKDYNLVRSHSSLGYLAPEIFRQQQELSLSLV
jgi:transposase InsO family protein